MALNGPVAASNDELPVAVDISGGDRGIDVVIDGAIQAFMEFGVRSILVGPQDIIKKRLDALGASQLPLEIGHAPDVIGMGESPARSVRKKPNSSLCVAYQLLQSGRASSMISAGNSGAMMAAGALICGLVPGIERPAIATLIPCAGDNSPNVILDSGANVDCNANHLVEFAIMGAVYCSSLFNISRPRVALLSNGSEVGKGNDIIRSAASALGQLESINYVGYVEGRDVGSRAADVIVCDGFVGNVVLKSMEGSVRLIYEEIRHTAKKRLVGRLGLWLARGIFKEIFTTKFDYTAHGGAPLLGLRKLAVVLHGSSDARAVKNAVRVAATFARSKMTEKIEVELARYEETLLDFDGTIFPGMLVKQGALGSENLKKKKASAEGREKQGGDED